MTIIEGFDDRRVLATLALRGLAGAVLVAAGLLAAWGFALAAIFNHFCVAWS